MAFGEMSISNLLKIEMSEGLNHIKPNSQMFKWNSQKVEMKKKNPENSVIRNDKKITARNYFPDLTFHQLRRYYRI